MDSQKKLTVNTNTSQQQQPSVPNPNPNPNPNPKPDPDPEPSPSPSPQKQNQYQRNSNKVTNFHHHRHQNIILPDSPLRIVIKSLEEKPDKQSPESSTTAVPTGLNPASSPITPTQITSLTQPPPVSHQTSSLTTASTTSELTQSQPSTTPNVLPLISSWTFFFSDISGTAKTPSSNRHFSNGSSHHLLKAAEYQSGMSQVFSSVGDVEGLCSHLIGFKSKVSNHIRTGELIPQLIQTSTILVELKRYSGSRSQLLQPLKLDSLISNSTSNLSNQINRNRLADLIMVPGGGLGLVVMRPQQNLHFFRTGVNPVWEDPWNSKGGRLTLTPPLVLLDPMFESVVLLMAGGILEAGGMKTDKRQGEGEGEDYADTDDDKQNKNDDSKEMEKKKPKVGGRVVGVVGSRRSKGDRIEIWLSGPSIGTAPEEEWIKSVQEVLGREIGTPDSKSLKYKKHLP
ncbi:hypothetical protein PPACK8108_LOCUS6376 [Phakopsora pachyrhizi]|uniref:Uncharacterized protein n=1 Tax=Phakopsora pachyrhizi TaxID=170000 RepID=A0AAV0AQT0_PHAPC|nr:hypothetical protein PPACK8108_LOCUS6376 [Phakopsora pachyrhizi]